MRLKLRLATLILFAGHGLMAQSTNFGQLYTSNPYPVFRLSQDGKTLAVTSISEEPKNKWLSFIDLETFRYKPNGSVSLLYSSVSNNLAIAYGSEFNAKGYAGSGDWIPYKKYMSWYYPNSQQDQKLQWSDEHFILAVRSDGNLISAGRVQHVSEKSTSYYSFRDLQVVEPNSGRVLETLKKGEFMKVARMWTPSEAPTLINNDSLLLWQSFSELSTLKLDGSMRKALYRPFPLQAVSGKWGMALKMDDKSTANNMVIKKSIIDLETFEIVYDNVIEIKNAKGYWAAAGKANRFYVLNGLTSVLYEEEWTGNDLRIVDSIFLDVKDILQYKVWLGYINDYKLIVSKEAGKVLLLPAAWSQWNNEKNEVFIWRFDNGTLVHRNPDYIRPTEAFMAKFNNSNLPSSPVAAAPKTLPLNALVRKKGGGPFYILMSQDAGTKKWWVSRFMLNRHGRYDVVNESKDASEFSMFTTDIVSTTVCPVCKGGGKINVTEARTTEKTDKMIYTQITTTKTENVNTLKSCSECKGLGFAGVH